MPEPIRIKIRGRYWRLIRCRLPRGVWGRCDAPNEPNKAIRIRPGLPPAEELRVLLHEMLHAGDWDLCEEAVDELSADMATVLIRDGWVKPIER